MAAGYESLFLQQNPSLILRHEMLFASALKEVKVMMTWQEDSLLSCVWGPRPPDSAGPLSPKVSCDLTWWRQLSETKGYAQCPCLP